MGNSIVCVPQSQLYAVEQFGKFKDILKPGCHFIGCDIGGACYNTRPIDLRLNQLTISQETKTKDNVFVNVQVAIQYKVVVEKQADSIYKLQDPTQQIDQYVTNVVRSQVPTLQLDEVFQNKDTIQLQIKEQLQKELGEFGFHIANQLMTDIEPDQRVKNSMNEINASKRLRQQAFEKQEGEKTLQVKAAEADQESKLLQGQGIQKQRQQIVNGLKDSLRGDGEDAAALNPERVTELLLITQYFDTLEKMQNGRCNTIFMAHTPGNLATIAEQMRQGILEGNAEQTPLLQQEMQGYGTKK